MIESVKGLYTVLCITWCLFLIHLCAECSALEKRTKRSLGTTHDAPRARANAMATTSDETKTEAVTSARSYYMGEGPYALNEDDSAVDPVAFREALMQDAEKLKSIEQDEELAKALLGEDTGTMQEALKKSLAMVRARTT